MDDITGRSIWLSKESKYEGLRSLNWLEGVATTQSYMGTMHWFSTAIPWLNLEDKVDLEEESSVRPPLLFTYNRRKENKSREVPTVN